MADLDRFVEAQAGRYATALSEIQEGRKNSHWMWFFFPQLAGLGRSSTARFYGITGRSEAESYLGHPLLGARLHECIAATLAWSGIRSAITIFGSIDALKLRSSMTLFSAVGARGADEALHAFYDGEADPLTVEMLDAVRTTG